MHDGSLYNCFKVADVATSTGFTKLGVGKVGALITRGVLIDVAAFKGVDMLGDTTRSPPPILKARSKRRI
jgi:hypothetical protein